jgi:hypothetical protein
VRNQTVQSVVMLAGTGIMCIRRIVLLLLVVSLSACARGGEPRNTPSAGVPATSTRTPSPTPTPVSAAFGVGTPVPSAATSPSPPTAALPKPTRSPALTPYGSPTPVPSPTQTPTLRPPLRSAPTATRTADAGPIVYSFRANVAEADPGDKIVLEWQTQGASEAVLYHIPPSGQLPQSGWQVQPSGVYTYEVKSDERNRTDFFLFVRDASERDASAYLTIRLRCPEPWFFSPEPDVCPTSPISSAAAEQHFEGGTMVWVQERWNDWVDEAGWIVVLYEDAGRKEWSLHRDAWFEGQPDRDPNLKPPPGFVQPVRGFGWLWRENSDVRERLGWAVDQEAGFQTTLQHTTRFKYNSTYLRALDGNVWHLGPERSSWDKIIAGQ